MAIKNLFHRIKRERSAYFFILPTLILSLTLLFYPLTQGVWLSFFKANLRAQNWVGFKNYWDLMNSPMFWLTLKNTFILVAILVPLLICFSLILASLILKFNRYLQTFFRATFYLPTISSGIVMAMVWLWIFEPTYGLLNYLLSLFGVPPVIWLGTVNPARFSVAFVVFTWLLGSTLILYLAALSAIPKTIYEAAEMDGAGILQKFFKVTIPLVMPMTLYLLVTSTIGAFQIWEAVYLLTAGGPAYGTTTLAYRIYYLGFRYYRFGQASSYAVILLIIVFSIAFFQFRHLRKEVEF